MRLCVANATYSFGILNVLFFLRRNVTTRATAVRRTAARKAATVPPIIALIVPMEALGFSEVVPPILLLWVMELLGDSDVVLMPTLNASAAVQSSSLRAERGTGQVGFTVRTTPPTVRAVPLMAQASIRGMREPLSVSEVPSSLARYVTYVGERGSQLN